MYLCLTIHYRPIVAEIIGSHVKNPVMMAEELQEREVLCRDCPLCGRSAEAARQSRYSDSRWVMKVCHGCGFVYLMHAPVYGELVSDYSWHKTAFNREQEKRKLHPWLYRISKSTRWRLHLFRRKRAEDLVQQYAAGGNVLDIGCGKGTQLNQLPSSYTPYGIEISEVEASHARELLDKRGGRVIVGPAVDGLQALSAGSFSAVIMRSYLEHEAQPRKVLEKTGDVLQPGGAVIIKVPNFACFNRVLLGSKWSGFRFPDHLNYFTPATLRAMCHEAGLSIRRFGFMDRFPSGDNMWLVAGKP